jgi:hypothetical protein
MENRPSWDDYDRAAKKARKSAGNKKRRGKRHQDRQQLRDWVNDINYRRKEDYDDYRNED